MFVMKKESMRKWCLMQAITLILSVMFMLFSTIAGSISAKAIGSLEDLGEVDLTAYTFDELCEKITAWPDSADKLKGSDKYKNALYYNLKNSQEYAKWYKNAIKYINHTGGAAGGTVTFKPTIPTVEGGYTEQKEAEAWAMYETYSNKMTMIMARGASEAMVGDIFGKEFDPTNAVTVAAMQTFTMACNATFNIIAKALMLLFLVQTGFDVVYLVLPFTQSILAPANASAGGGSAGLAQGKKFALRFNLVSNEAIEANNRGATGSVGTNGGTGGGFLQTNIAMRYLIARAPLIIIAFTYFVLVATNVWTSIITWTTSFITGIFYGL